MEGLPPRVLARLQSPLYFAKLYGDLEKRNAATDGDRKELMYGRLLMVCARIHVYAYMWFSVFEGKGCDQR